MWHQTRNTKENCSLCKSNIYGAVSSCCTLRKTSLQPRHSQSQFVSRGLLLAGHSAASASISLLQFVLQTPDEFATLTITHHSRSSVTQGPDVLKSRTHCEVILHPLSGPSNSGFYISLQDRIFGPSRLADIGQSSPLTVACTVSCGRG